MTQFADIEDAADWAKESLEITFANRIMDGTSNEHMDPLGTTTRAQAAIVPLRTLQRLELSN